MDAVLNIMLGGLLFLSILSSPLPMLVPLVSVAYFRSSPKSVPILQRCAVSAHGVLIGSIGISIFFIAPHSSYAAPFTLALLIPLSFMVYSFFRYRGNRKIHYLQILNVLALLALYNFGNLLITGF